MADDDPIVIGNPLRKRTSETGKERYTIDIRAEPIIADMNPKTLGLALAGAVAQVLRDKVTGITASASEATIKARKVAAKAFAAGKPWAVKRYSGGRTGAMAPTGDTRAFNDSGRFAKSIVAQAQDDQWVVNVAANRLNPEMSNIERVWTRLTSLVPEFGTPALLAANETVQRGIQTGVAAAIVKAKETGDELSVARLRAYISVARAALDVFKAFVA